MTLAPDRIGYHRPGEVDDAPEVTFTPIVRDPVRLPETAPTFHERDKAADIILWHFEEYAEEDVSDSVIHALVVVNLRHQLNPRGFQTLLADYRGLPWNGHHLPADHAEAFLTAIAEYLRNQGYDNRKDQP